MTPEFVACNLECIDKGFSASVTREVYGCADFCLEVL